MLNKILQSFTEKLALKILYLSFAVYVLVFFSWCCLKYHGFSYDDFDLAIHDQIIWNILHGSVFNSILGIDFLGNHVHFISFLVAPLYWLIPHPLFLLFLQTVFLAAGVFPLYALARMYLSYPLSLMVCIVYLLYPGLGYTNLYEFHPTCFATFFLLCTAYYFYKEKFALFTVFMALSLTCQENIALIFIMWGIYAFILRRAWQWVLWPLCTGFLYFLFCVYIVLPYFNKDVFNFFSIYGALGNSLGQVVHTCIFNPALVKAIIFQPSKFQYLVHLFDSVAFIPLLSPLALLPVFLIFMQHLLSSRVTEISLYYHYTAELIPFIFVGFVFGVKKVTDYFSEYKYIGYIFLLNAIFVTFTLGPHFRWVQEWENRPSDYSIAQNESLLKEIPKDAAVVSTFQFLSHLSHHKDLYSFHYIYSGHYTLSDKPFFLPDNVQYALIDFNDIQTFASFYRSYRYRNIDDFLKKGSWGTVDVSNNIVLFKKGTQNKYPLFSFINDQVMAPHPVNLTVDGSIKLNGYDFDMRSDRIDLIFYWELLRPELKDINIYINLIDQNGNIIDMQYRPLCYRIWPTQAWQKGQLIEEHQYISLSPLIKGRVKSLVLGFYDFKTGKLITTDSRDFLGRVGLKLAN